jgi:hypothetical protein
LFYYFDDRFKIIALTDECNRLTFVVNRKRCLKCKNDCINGLCFHICFFRKKGFLYLYNVHASIIALLENFELLIYCELYLYYVIRAWSINFYNTIQLNTCFLGQGVT